MRIQPFNSDGSFLYTPDSGFRSGTDVFHYLASDGYLSSSDTTVSIYVVDATAGRVVHLAAGGRQLGSVGPVFADPYDVEAGDGGALYVIDTSAHGRLYRIAPDGTYRVVARRT